MRRRLREGAMGVALAISLVMAPAFIPGTASLAFAATDKLTLNPTADAWVSSANPDSNYGKATSQRARVGKAETYMRFNLSPWQGLRIGALSLLLKGVSGDAAPLRVATTDPTWQEKTVTWNTRPATVTSVTGAPVLGTATARFDLKSLFPTGFVDTVILNVRVSTPKDLLVTFGSRETSTTQPKLVLEVSSRADTVDLPTTADAWADSSNPTTNYATAPKLRSTASPAREAFMKFDMSAWLGFTYTSLKLRLYLTSDSTPTITVYRVGYGWHENDLTWNSRPTGGTQVAKVTTTKATGWRAIDITPAFSGQKVDKGVLALRVVATGGGFLVADSRETTNTPAARLTPGLPAQPPAPTPTPTATPTQAPKATPSPTPTATPTPTPTATPVPQFYYAGRGTDHGVGLSQTGAKGRANQGQTYEQILNAYYTGVSLAPVPVEKETIRVLLASAFVPTATEPARVIAKNGPWTSAAFPEMTFPADSYLDMDKQADGTWTANVHEALTGEVLASVASATDLTMTPVDSTTLFYMKFRDSLRKYDTYRGSMRVRVNGSGIMCVNVVDLDDYVQGVVPAEMIPSWPIEALKAQAIAARTYGAVRIKTTGYYDVVPTSANQVYGGYNIEYNKTNTATQSTAGTVVWYSGKMANTYFFDTGGGATENSEYAWPGSGGAPGTVVAYLRGIQDVNADGVPYDINANNYSWSSGQFSMAQLSNIYKHDSRTNVGTIKTLTFYRGVSGRLYKVVMLGTGGTTKTVSGAIFKNVYNNYKLSGASLKSTLFYLTPVSP